MLIDLSRHGPLTINPLEYRTTLAVRIDTDDRPECGVFAGKHTDFERHEEGMLVPIIDNDDMGTGCKTFSLDRPKRGDSRRSWCRSWHYAAIGWDSGIYIEHPYVYQLTLKEHDEGPENYFWAVFISMHRGSGFTLILPDYEPGALARGV